jgi:hypothetical protein
LRTSLASRIEWNPWVNTQELRACRYSRVFLLCSECSQGLHGCEWSLRHGCCPGRSRGTLAVWGSHKLPRGCWWMEHKSQSTKIPSAAMVSF